MTGVPWMDVIVYFFAVLCQSVSCVCQGCFAMAIDMLRLVEAFSTTSTE